MILGFQASILCGYFLLLRTTKFQPEKVDFTPYATFLNQKEHVNYRYLTLGFGCQLARLSTLTNAPSVDGLYYTARTPEILRTSGIEAIDFAKYFGKAGDVVLHHYLSKPERYSLKYVLVNDGYYEAKLNSLGWKKVAGINGVWMTPKEIKPLQKNVFQTISKVPLNMRKLWGSYPLLFLLLLILEVYRAYRRYNTLYL